MNDLEVGSQIFGLYLNKIISEGQRISSSELVKNYWGYKHPKKASHYLTIMEKYSDYEFKGLDPTSYLLELLNEYPDAPDILNFLAQTYHENEEHITAIKYYMKLTELYPFVSDYQRRVEACRAYIEADSMPESEETLEWLKKRLQEIWN